MDCMRPPGGVKLPLHASRNTTVIVHARQSGYRRQEWRSDGPASGGRGRGRGGRGGPARGRGGRHTNPRPPNRPPRDNFDNGEDELGPGTRGPRPVRPDWYDNPQTERRDPELQPRRASGETQDPFGNLLTWIQTQHGNGVVIRRETWEKLLGHIRAPAQAGQALDLLAADAGVREAAGWDWATHGYGQTAFQLAQVAAAVGAPEVAEQLLERREALHLTLNKDLVPTLIRKVAAATANADPDDAEVDGCVEIAHRLYEQEAALRGANTSEAAYELSRVLRRAGDVRGVRSLHEQMLREGLAVRDRLLEDMERWLAKRGVRV